MKKSTWIFIVLAVVLGAAAYYISTSKNSGSTIEADERDFAIADTQNITKIFIASRHDRSSLLERQADGTWTVNKDYKARKDGIDILLETINRITVKAPVSKAKFDHVVKHLSTRGVKVEIYKDGKKPFKTYYVGTPNQDHTGSFMMIDGATKPFLMHMEGFFGFLSTRYIYDENQWRDNEVFRYAYGDIKQIEVKHPLESEKDFTIAMQDSAYILKDGKGNIVPTFNKVNVVSFVGLFKDLNFEGFENNKEESVIDSVKASVPFKEINVTDVDGNTKNVKFYRKPMPPGSTDYDGNPIEYDIDRLYLWIDEETFVIGQYFVFDKIDASFQNFAQIY
tara:strand:- start:1698 stop:2708 length:1011 start_codon:yes stop_codon:yes gene_type:complete